MVMAVRALTPMLQGTSSMTLHRDNNTEKEA